MVKTAKSKPKTNKKRSMQKKPASKKQIKRIVRDEICEKKRFYIAPIALTNGDITCSAPYNASNAGGAFSQLFQPFSLGQQFCNGSFGVSTIGGWTAIDITPHPQEGNTFSTREGSSINLMSSFMRFQFSQQSSNTLTPIRIRMVILHTLGAPDVTALTTMTNWYLNSALPNGSAINSNNGIIDFNSNVSPDYRGQYRKIYEKTTTLHQDSVATGLQVREHQIKLKYNKGLGHTVRFVQNAQVITGGQLTLLLTADAGNMSNANTFTGAGAATLVNNTDSSGCFVNFNICHYYIDP